jgi:fatty-acyl-CoA synthase
MMLDVPASSNAVKADFDASRKADDLVRPGARRHEAGGHGDVPNSGLFELYGSTEAGWVTMLHPDEQFDHLGTVGREVVGSAADQASGRCRARRCRTASRASFTPVGPYCLRWLLERLPEKTAEAFRGDYLSVGDIAYAMPDGFIRLIDRKKNMIITGGENVYPSEVEAVLGQHPAVARRSRCIGRPDDKWGERVTAAVVLRGTGSSVSA